VNVHCRAAHKLVMHFFQLNNVGLSLKNKRFTSWCLWSASTFLTQPWPLSLLTDHRNLISGFTDIQRLGLQEVNCGQAMFLGDKASRVQTHHRARTGRTQRMCRHDIHMDTQTSSSPRYGPVALRRSLLDAHFAWPSLDDLQQCQEQSSSGTLKARSPDGVLMFMGKVWIPDANNFRVRICIAGLFLRIQVSLGRCLYCRVNNKCFIRQPVEEAMHGCTTNKVLHLTSGIVESKWRNTKSLLNGLASISLRGNTWTSCFNISQSFFVLFWIEPPCLSQAKVQISLAVVSTVCLTSISSSSEVVSKFEW